MHQGLNFSITNYINLFVLQLSRTQMMFFPLVLLGAVVLMFVTIGPLHQRFGKAKTAGLGMIVGTMLGMVPFTLLLTGLWPMPGSTASAVMYFGFAMIATALGITSLVSATSMIAEIVEAFENAPAGARKDRSIQATGWCRNARPGRGFSCQGRSLPFRNSHPTPRRAACLKAC